MQQIIEGLDNEVALLLFFTTAVIAVVFPLYIVKLFQPTTERSTQERNDNQPENPDEAHPNVPQQNVADSQTNAEVPPETNTEIPPTNTATLTEETPSESFIIKVKLQEESQEQNVTPLLKLKELKQYVDFATQITSLIEIVNCFFVYENFKPRKHVLP